MFTLRAARQPAFVRQITSPPVSRAVAGRRFAHQDYGSGATKSSEPNPAVDQEHPGPPPPAVGQGKGEQETKKQASNQVNKSENDGANSKSTSNGAQPKILSDNPPAKGEESEDVAKHNREMQQRADRPAESVKNEDAEKDKVSKDFWKGHGGRDGEP